MEKKMFKTGKALTIVRAGFLVLIMAAALGFSLWLVKLAWMGKNIINADTFGAGMIICSASPKKALNKAG